MKCPAGSERCGDTDYPLSHVTWQGGTEPQSQPSTAAALPACLKGCGSVGLESSLWTSLPLRVSREP